MRFFDQSIHFFVDFIEFFLSEYFEIRADLNVVAWRAEYRSTIFPDKKRPKEWHSYWDVGLSFGLSF